ncbi:hypothetical protein RLEG12_10310 (plasmid) [Rhizobium leguminosarum bv. trifolii CB782]|nr:hypothetical protein RLEG12_10310 [Rhizobium leguminosarum bv. trifolii CB782]
MFMIGAVGLGDCRMAMLLRRLDHEVDEGPRYAEFGGNILLRHAVEAVADEGIIGPLRERFQRGEHIAQGLGSDKLVEHGGDGSSDLLNLVYRPIVVHLLAPPAALVECEIINHAKGITDRATNVVDFDPIGFDDSVLKDVLGI